MSNNSTTSSSCPTGTSAINITKDESTSFLPDWWRRTRCSPAQSCHTVDGHAAAGLFLELQLQQVQPIVHYLVGGRGSVIKRPILEEMGKEEEGATLVISLTENQKTKEVWMLKPAGGETQLGWGVGGEGGTSCFHWLHGAIMHIWKNESCGDRKSFFNEIKCLERSNFFPRRADELTR